MQSHHPASAYQWCCGNPTLSRATRCEKAGDDMKRSLQSEDNSHSLGNAYSSKVTDPTGKAKSEGNRRFAV